MKTLGIRALATVVIALLISTAAATSASAAPQDDVVSKTNSARAAAGLPALVPDAKLNAAAQEWAQQMGNSRQMVHSSNDWRAARIPAGWTSHGENIAWGQTNATSVMNSWMNSEGHRNNILRAAYTRIGVGYVASGNYWVQIFGGYPSKPPVAQPFGKLDGATVSVQGTTAALAVHGWAIDRVRPTASIEAHVYVTDPTGASKGYALKADQPRSDIARAYPQAGAAHGYKTSIPITKAGVYKVCSYAIGTAVEGFNNVGVGCANVSFDPSKPIGNFDGATVVTKDATATLNVRGWALDNGSRATTTQAHVYVKDPTGKSTGYSLTANGSRPDVGNAYPGAGANHGFGLTVPLTKPGAYQVCTYSISASVFGSGNKPLGCKTVQFGPTAPIGSVDSVVGDSKARTITARGWVLDNGARSLPTQAHIYITSPSGKRTGYAVATTQQRTDVARVYAGAGNSHGFALVAPATASGRYQVCTYSISAPVFGAGNSALPCKTVVIG